MISSIRLLALLRGKWLYTYCSVKKGHQVCCSPQGHKELDTTDQLNNHTVETLSEERWMTLRKLRTRVRWQNSLTPSLSKKKKKNRLNTLKWLKVLFHCVWSKIRYSTVPSSNKIEMGHTWITDSLSHTTLVLMGWGVGRRTCISKCLQKMSMSLCSQYTIFMKDSEWFLLLSPLYSSFSAPAPPPLPSLFSHMHKPIRV